MQCTRAECHPYRTFAISHGGVVAPLRGLNADKMMGDHVQFAQALPPEVAVQSFRQL